MVEFGQLCLRFRSLICFVSGSDWARPKVTSDSPTEFPQVAFKPPSKGLFIREPPQNLLTF